MSTKSDTGSAETHLSRLFFTPTRVYKQLKPVTMPFVDFSDSDVRMAAAHHEFERNQGISPDVYLGLADIYEDGAMVDKMIVMRRLPAERELRLLLNQGNDRDLIRTAARHVATMHSGLMPLRGEQAEPASIAAVTQNWEDNFETIGGLVGAVIDATEFDQVQTLARSYLAGREPLFEQRVKDGWVRDGHGDLRAEHIYCTDDGPRMIDCVAFDDRLRISDALADVAFLAMDLDRLVGPQGAGELMRCWNEFTNEHHPSSLAHFYVAYRAHVRCKIACLRHEQGQAGAAATAQAYHLQALRHLRLAQVRLILIGGGPGSGKSTVAEGVAKAYGAVWLRADEIRKDIAGVAHDEHAIAEPGEGIYTHEVTAQLQTELRRQAGRLVRNGVSVVIDATWRDSWSRDAMRRIANDASAHLSELRCVLPAAIAKERIARRMASIYNPSDATPELVDYMADRFDPWPQATAIDTSSSIADSVAAACAAVGERGACKDPADAPAESFVVDLTSLRYRALINGDPMVGG